MRISAMSSQRPPAGSAPASAPGGSVRVRRTAYEPGTEGLRGLAALMVVYTHLLAPFPDVDPLYRPSPLFWKFEAGQGAVLLFFVLSGYVIGLTNDTDFRRGLIGNYVQRRALRILPLYWVSIILSVAVRPVDRGFTIFGNAFLLQNDLPYGRWHVPQLAANTNLWSLNYEALYYLLFLAVWASGKKWKPWLCGTGVLAIAAWRLPAGGALIASYAAGWTFWMAGYGLAMARHDEAEAAGQRLPWPSLILLWLVTWHTNPTWFLARRLHLLPATDVWMNYTYFDFIPSCVALLIVASGRRPRGFKIITGLTLAIPLTFLLWRRLRPHPLSPDFVLEDILCVVAAVLWFYRPSTKFFAWVAPVGAISYGLYIFQRPVQWLIRDASWLPTGSVGSFVARLVLIFAASMFVAWLAERRLQPWLRRLFRPLLALLALISSTIYRRLYWLPLDLRIGSRLRGVKTAVYYGDSIGDNLLCTAVLRELARRGHRQIAMLTPFPELFAHNPHVQVVLPGEIALSGSLPRLGKRLMLPNYNVITDDPDRDRAPQQHVVAEMCASIGLTGRVEVQPEMFLTPAEAAAGRRGARQIAIVSAGAGARVRMRNKEWPADRFQLVADALQASATLIQLGTAADPPLEGVLDLRGRTTLREAAAILSHCECFIGIAGFLQHLARAVRCPAVIVFGGREDPAMTGYRSNENLYTPVPCSPCWQRNRCDHERICLSAITPDDVLAAVARIRARAGDPIAAETVELGDEERLLTSVEQIQ
jgi:peptidoglycan/LPS O-acetylase OafA/YrhL/ADP-heptose:LPS heptosyltransferase